jgi:hypothetical protein
MSEDLTDAGLARYLGVSESELLAMDQATLRRAWQRAAEDPLTLEEIAEAAEHFDAAEPLWEQVVDGWSARKQRAYDEIRQRRMRYMNAIMARLTPGLPLVVEDVWTDAEREALWTQHVGYGKPPKWLFLGKRRRSDPPMPEGS